MTVIFIVIPIAWLVATTFVVALCAMAARGEQALLASGGAVHSGDRAGAPRPQATARGCGETRVYRRPSRVLGGRGRVGRCAG